MPQEKGNELLCRPAGTSSTGTPNSSNPCALEGSSLFQQLSEKERLALLTRLTPQLSVAGQVAMLEWLTSQLPSEASHQVIEELRQRLVQSSPPPVC